MIRSGTPSELAKKIKSNMSEILVVSQVSKEKINLLQEFNLNGVYFSIDNSRYYPFDDALCQTLGYISTDGSGQTGLEKYYNDYLQGANGESFCVAVLLNNLMYGFSEQASSAAAFFTLQNGRSLCMGISIFDCPPQNHTSPIRTSSSITGVQFSAPDRITVWACKVAGLGGNSTCHSPLPSARAS